MNIRRALILAAGLGSRLRPLTWKTPKPLIPVWGTPLLDHAIQTLQRWGVQEFAINTHWNSEAIEAHLAQHWPHLPLHISHETEILGTGGALLPLRDFLASEDAFWVFNADVIASMDGPAFALQHARSGALASLWMTPEAGPRTVALAPDGRILSFHSPTPGAPNTATFTGIQLVSPRIYDYLPTSTPSSSIQAYRTAIKAGETVLGHTLPHTFWADGGTPAAYLALHREIRTRHHAHLPGAEFYNPAFDPNSSFCAPTSSLPNPAPHLHDCVIAPNASFASPNIHLQHCIVGPHTHISASRENTILVHPSAIPEPRLTSALNALHWDPSLTAVEELEARGSDRAFYRLQHQGQRAILAVHGTQRPENNTYAPLAHALSNAGIRVAPILAHSAHDRWVAMADLGEHDLLANLHSTPPDHWHALYETALQTVADLHRLGSQRFANNRDSHLLQPPFSPDLYRWERDLFSTHFLLGYLHLSPTQITPILDELIPCANALLQAQPVLIHRDLQSTNIFLQNNHAWLIDFQGTRFGAAAYDLASLLCDPYAALPTTLRSHLLHYYASLVPWGPQTIQLFPYAAIQRLIQALGAYGRLSALPGTSRFAQHIPSAASILLQIIQNNPSFSHLQATLTPLTNP